MPVHFDTAVNATKLRRTLNLPLLVLYGLGTTIGAGIYVLVGTAAGRAGIYAPMAFFVAAIAIAPTAATYGELASRFPVAAGEAAYVKEGFKSTWASVLVGWLVIISGIVASAAIAIGCAGYLRTFVNIPLPWALTLIIFSMGMMAIWGILQSVLLAALFTLIEVGGLFVLIWAGITSQISLVDRIPETLPPIDDIVIWLGISNAGLLAVFAFIGFEDMVNVAEETKEPQSTLPKAIFLTLAITTALYTAVTLVAVLAVAPSELAASEAPLSLVFERLTGMTPAAISAIAVFATLNTILVQQIMASRVIYGLANQKLLPAVFATVNKATQTPIVATVVVMVATLGLALWFPIGELAELTSHMVLAIWALANAALILLKWRKVPAPDNAFTTPMWVPVLGLVLSLALVAVSNIM
jgi:APA family basic amino acid/polyamine antiporter